MPPPWQAARSTTSRFRGRYRDDIEESVDEVVAHGVEIVQPISAQAPDLTASLRDPAGNVPGLYQEPTDA